MKAPELSVHVMDPEGVEGHVVESTTACDGSTTVVTAGRAEVKIGPAEPEIPRANVALPLEEAVKVTVATSEAPPYANETDAGLNVPTVEVAATESVLPAYGGRRVTVMLTLTDWPMYNEAGSPEMLTISSGRISIDWVDGVV